jgi:hypothetical protein
VVDLLYGARAWEVLFQHWEAEREAEREAEQEFTYLYLHCGGLEGSEPLAERYGRRGLGLLPDEAADLQRAVTHLLPLTDEAASR